MVVFGERGTIDVGGRNHSLYICWKLELMLEQASLRSMKDLCGGRIQIHHFTVADPASSIDGRRRKAIKEEGALPKVRDGPDLIPPPSPLRRFDGIH